MKILLKKRDGTSQDITQLVSTVAWSGDVQEVARKLEFGILTSRTDSNIPKIEGLLGESVSIWDDDNHIYFQGRIFTRDQDSSNDEIKYTCFDDSIYILKSKISKNFINKTPLQITTEICKDFSIQIGKVANPNITCSYPIDKKTAYESIMTAYTIASRKNKKKYRMFFMSGKLHVVEQGTNYAATLDGNYNLEGISASDTIENMVNKVVITDDKGNNKKIVEDADLRKTYGTIQDVIEEKKGVDATQEAKELIKGVEKTISVSGIGNLNCMAGQNVYIIDKFTNLVGLFYIVSDSHTFENGNHFMSLGVSHEQTMDYIEAEKFDKKNKQEDKIIYWWESDK